MKKILITGGSGLLGKSLYPLIPDGMFISSGDIDLTQNKDVIEMISDINPSLVIHLAGKVGGISDNISHPYDFLAINTKINSNVIDSCVIKNIPIVFSSSSCVYPKESKIYPMTEEMVNNGEPEPTNDGYAYAKRQARNMLYCAKKQYGYNYTVLYFCNLYGANDNFIDSKKSHLVTTLIKKMHDAKIKNQSEIVLLGTGEQRRQFMSASDAAKIIKIIVDNNITGEYNVSPTENKTVREIANVVKEIVEYDGNISFNNDTALNGVSRKDISSERLINIIGDFDFLSLRNGIKETYKLFLEKYYVEINE